MLTIFLGGWSVATLANGLVGGIAGLLLCRVFLGVMEPGGFNACQRAIMEWFPVGKRGLALSLLAPGTALGSVLAPPLLAQVNDTFGWRWGFLLPGAFGIALAAVWWSATRPSAIGEGSPPAANREPVVPLRQILASPALWGLLLARAITDPVWYFYQFWLPGYFQEDLGLSLAAYGRIGWIPPTVATIACVGLGLWTDRRIARRGRSLRIRRGTLIALTALAPAALLTPIVDGEALTLVLVTIVVSVGQAWLFFGSLLQTDLFPRHAIGTANGLIGACGATFGLGLNLALGWIVPAVGYGPVFFAASLLYPMAAWLVWRLVREPMVATTPP
jgi:ACS family hexuronate transporter-like MFS transporter